MRHVALALLTLALLRGAGAEEAELQGFIVDNTISRIGNDFYAYFCDRLRDVSKLDFNLVVRERPSLGWGSLVWVEYDRRIVYRSFLQPNTAQLRDTATQAADQVLEQISRQKLENLLNDHSDMDKDEI